MLRRQVLIWLLVVGLLGPAWSCDVRKQVQTESPVAESVNDGAVGQDTSPSDVGLPGDAAAEGVVEEVGVRESPPQPTSLTYHKDIRAIVQVKCLGCHQQGGVGPFALDTYEKLFATRQAVASAVKDGRMPPWLGTKECNQYSNDISLSTAQRASIVQWISEGAAEGDPKDYVAPPETPGIGLSRIDSTLLMKKPYVPAKSPDDHRCFVLDWPHTSVKYISGFGIKAGKLDMVHHVIAYLAHPKHAASYANKDPDGNGFYCPGTASGNAGLNWIGVWAPGVPGGNYPEGTGLQVDPGSKIIVQIHYNTTSVKPVADQSAVQFKLEDQVNKRALMVPFTNFLTWTSSKGMKIPKGDAAKEYTFSIPVSVLSTLLPGIKELNVYSAMLHMHQLGTKGELSAIKDEEYQCLLDVPRWDFNWQLLYNLNKPITLSGNDKLSISCTFNNSAANQPLIDGKKQEPKDVYWGDSTSDEMCLGVFYVTCGDAPCPKLDNF